MAAFYWLVADAYVRKPIIYLGYVVFVVGCVVSMVSATWDAMTLGCVLQGLGAAAPRIATLAMVRDVYERRAMASVLSIVLTPYIIVPIMAPMLGQGFI